MIREQGQAAIKTPFLLRIKQIASQLLLNEFELAYWHAVNTSCYKLWSMKTDALFEKLLSNALFVKTHCNDREESKIFRAFAIHNYPALYKKHFSEAKPGDQRSWMKVGDRNLSGVSKVQ
jgi:hypothetical protein